MGKQGVAAEAEEAAGGKIGVNARRASAGRDADQMQGEAAVQAAEVGVNPEAVVPCGGRTVVEGLDEWMWSGVEGVACGGARGAVPGRAGLPDGHTMMQQR